MTSVPEPVAYVRDLLRGFGHPWLLSGGWAADAWLGRQTRPHHDVDITVFHTAQSALFAHFPGWAMIGHDPNVPDATTEQWNGRRLDPPAHIHMPVHGSTLSTSDTLTHSAFEFEFLLNESSDTHWILHRNPEIAVPLEQATILSPWGVPTAGPEIILFFKADETLRPHDTLDFHALLPLLDPAQRFWLREAIGALHPCHPWLPSLTPTGTPPQPNETR